MAVGSDALAYGGEQIDHAVVVDAKPPNRGAAARARRELDGTPRRRFNFRTEALAILKDRRGDGAPSDIELGARDS